MFFLFFWFYLPIGGRCGCTLGCDGASFCTFVVYCVLGFFGFVFFSLFSLAFISFFGIFGFTSPLVVDAVAHWAVTVRSPDTRTRPRSEASIPGHVLEMKI